MDGTLSQVFAQAKSTNIDFRVKLQELDTGIAMSEDYKSRMFTPFEQENAATVRTYGGSGLGLSISNNLANMMGGKITVQSTPMMFALLTGT